MSVHGHKEVIGEFYCPLHKVYICQDCFEDHKDDIGEFGRADATKNHLAKLFIEWSHLLDHAKRKTILQLNTNLEKHKALIGFLKSKSQIQPDIDAVTLLIIYKRYVQKLAEKIQQMKVLCQQNNLNQAIAMRYDYEQFTIYLTELEQRSTTTDLLASYMINRNPSRLIPTVSRDTVLETITLFSPKASLKKFEGLTQTQKFFLLRKQYDARIKELS